MSGPETMRAVRVHRPGDATSRQVQVDEIPVPRPGPREVLVRVAACGVCASDLHVVDGTTPVPPEVLPLVLGHEAAGTVAAVGDEVGDWQVGDRVAVMPGRACGRCVYCTTGRENLCRSALVGGTTIDGAQAQYALAEPDGLVPVPGAVPIEQAAILMDAVATPYHALKRGGVGEGVTVAIYGLGGLGMHAVQLAKLAGAHVIGVDVDEVNLQRAREWGADEVVDASDGRPARQVRALTDGGVDSSYEFVGSSAVVDQAVKSLRPGGRACVVGVTIEPLQTLPTALLVAQELEIVGSFGASLQDVNELMDLLEVGRLDLSRSITHRYTIDEFDQALRQLSSREDHPIRVVVTHDLEDAG